MNRLTQRHENGEAYVLLYASPTDNLRISKEVVDKQKMVIERLAAYEDTGLTPEEIMDGKMLTGWIPCSEKLPEKEICVMLSTMYGVAEGCYKGNGKWVQFRWSAKIDADDVFAWQPLPEPWEGDKE